MKLSAQQSGRIHGGLAVLWLFLAVPTFLWWTESVPWLVWMSLYAIVAAHWAGYQGARAERNSGN